VNFTADKEFRELLEEVRALISHAEPKGDLLKVMKRGLEALRSELLKKRFGLAHFVEDRLACPLAWHPYSGYEAGPASAGAKTSTRLPRREHLRDVPTITGR
jgi:hypothetical protein